MMSYVTNDDLATRIQGMDNLIIPDVLFSQVPGDEVRLNFYAEVVNPKRLLGELPINTVEEFREAYERDSHYAADGVPDMAHQLHDAVEDTLQQVASQYVNAAEALGLDIYDTHFDD